MPAANAAAFVGDYSVMRLALCALVASGCVSIDDAPKPWVAAELIAAPLSPELGPAPMPPPSPTTLRLASWNVELGAHPEALANEIVTSPVLASADILIVQEIEDHPGEPGSRASRLAAALGMTWFYAPAREQDDGTHGDAILSRFPLSAPEVKQLPFVDQPVNSRPRIAQRAVIDLGTRSFTLVNIHLDTRLAPVDRIRQLDPAVADNPPDTIVGGDLNTLPWIWVDTAVPLTGSEAVLGQDQAQIVDDYLAAQGFATPIVHDADTHESVIDMRLDALCPRGFAVLGAGVDYTVSGSDHYAVWIDIDAR